MGYLNSNLQGSCKVGNGGSVCNPRASVVRWKTMPGKSPEAPGSYSQAYTGAATTGTLPPRGQWVTRGVVLWPSLVHSGHACLPHYIHTPHTHTGRNKRHIWPQTNHEGVRNELRSNQTALMSSMTSNFVLRLCQYTLSKHGTKPHLPFLYLHTYTRYSSGIQSKVRKVVVKKEKKCYKQPKAAVEIMLPAYFS